MKILNLCLLDLINKNKNFISGKNVAFRANANKDDIFQKSEESPEDKTKSEKEIEKRRKLSLAAKKTMV